MFFCQDLATVVDNGNDYKWSKEMKRSMEGIKKDVKTIKLHKK